MNFEEYQAKAYTFALESAKNHTYATLNLVAEVGEICGKLAKYTRDGGDWSEIERQLRKEVGDAQWQLAHLCTMHGWKLQEIAEDNIAKLTARKEFGTIRGSGDDR